MKCQIFVDILLLIGVVYLFIQCNKAEVDYVHNAPYDINYYMDTIENNVILTAVVNSHDNRHISSTTIKLK